MKRLSVLLFILAVATEARAQIQNNPVSVYGQVVVVNSATTASTAVSVVGMGITAFQFTCNPLDTVSTAGVTLQTSQDGVTWSSTIASVDCSAPNQSAVTTGSANQVRINATTFSGTGSVRVAWRGLTSSASSSSTDVVTELEEVVAELEAANTTLDSIDTNTGSTDPVPVLARGTDTGGVTGFAIVTSATTNGQIVNAAPTGLYGISVFNFATTASYLRLYNAVAPPSACGATGFVRSLPIPPASAAGQVGGFILMKTVPDTGSFTTGLSYCVTGGGTSSDNTVASSGIYINIDYYDAP